MSIIKGHCQQLSLVVTKSDKMKWEFDKEDRFSEFYATIPDGTDLIQTICRDTLQGIKDHDEMYGYLELGSPEAMDEYFRRLKLCDAQCWYRGGNRHLPNWTERTGLGNPNFPLYLPVNMFDKSNVAEFKFGQYTIQLTKAEKRKKRKGEFKGTLTLGGQIREDVLLAVKPKKDKRTSSSCVIL